MGVDLRSKAFVFRTCATASKPERQTLLKMVCVDTCRDSTGYRGRLEISIIGLVCNLRTNNLGRYIAEDSITWKNRYKRLLDIGYHLAITGVSPYQ